MLFNSSTLAVRVLALRVKGMGACKVLGATIYSGILFGGISHLQPSFLEKEHSSKNQEHVLFSSFQVESITCG